MYSIVLFIVDTSLSGFFGSGERPTSAVDRIFLTSSSGARPVNSTCPFRPSSSRSATSSSKQSPEPISVKAMSSRPHLVDHDVGGPHDDVHAVLRPHDADVGGEELAGRGAAPALPGPRLSLSGSGPVRTTVTSAGALPLLLMAIVAVGVVGGDHVVRGAVRAALERPQPPVRQPSGRRGTGTGTAPGTGRGGRRRTWCRRAARSARAIGQKMSGGLHACMTANRPAPAGLEGQPGGREERVRVLGDEAELAAAWRVRPVLVEPTPSMTSYDGSPLPFGQTTATS